MELIREDTYGTDVRTRILACDCEEGCDTRFLALQSAGCPEQLWIVLVCGSAEHVELLSALEVAFAREDAVDIPATVEHYVALCGLPWTVLKDDASVCRSQMLVADAMPAWMVRLDTELVWRTRRCVYGDDLTRVPRALAAAHRYYVNEGPRP